MFKDYRMLTINSFIDGMYLQKTRHKCFSILTITDWYLRNIFLPKVFGQHKTINPC